MNQRALSEPQLFRILHLVIWCFLVPGLDKIALSKSTLNILRLCFNRALDPAKASTEAPASISCWRYFLVPGLVKSVLPAGTHLLWLNSTKAFFFGWVLCFVLSGVPWVGCWLAGVPPVAGPSHGTDGDPAELSPGHCTCSFPVPCSAVCLSVRPGCSKACTHGLRCVAQVPADKGITFSVDDGSEGLTVFISMRSHCYADHTVGL